MAEPKTICSNCDRQILQCTADDNDGLCAVCLRELQKSDEVHEYQVVPPDPIQLNVSINVSDLQVSDSIDWSRIENTLVSITSQYVQAFAKIHYDKAFYGFAFDCNADYGQVSICANTPTALTTQATESKARSPDLYGQLSIPKLEEKLRWSLGDWEFQAFTTEGFSDAWSPVEEFLVDLMPYDDAQRVDEFRNAFMETACRSMSRMEQDGTLDALSRTDSFKTFVADHDEADEESWGRLEAIRSHENC